MATEKPSAKTSTKKPPAAARAQAGTLPVEMSITDDSPAAGKMIQKLQRAIVDGLEDVKAQNIQVFNTEHLSPLFERVVIASGTSNRQTKALAASVRDAVRDAGCNKPRMEGEENGEWIIVDCGSAVVHIMQPAIRQYYTLEDIWGEKPVRLRMGAPAAKAAAEKKVSRTAARTAAKKEAAAAAAEEAGVAEEGVTSAAEAAAKPVRKTAAKPAADAAATDKPAKPRARKTPVVTVVVGKTVSKKAVKARS